jgi:hypothetical protein
VVEVEYNEIQKSPTYPLGLALRFARIARVRDDKDAGQATTLAELRHLYERQIRDEGRAGTRRRTTVAARLTWPRRTAIESRARACLHGDPRLDAMLAVVCCPAR